MGTTSITEGRIQIESWRKKSEALDGRHGSRKMGHDGTLATGDNGDLPVCHRVLSCSGRHMFSPRKRFFPTCQVRVVRCQKRIPPQSQPQQQHTTHDPPPTTHNPQPTPPPQPQHTTRNTNTIQHTMHHNAQHNTTQHNNPIHLLKNTGPLIRTPRSHVF